MSIWKYLFPLIIKYIWNNLQLAKKRTRILQNLILREFNPTPLRATSWKLNIQQSTYSIIPNRRHKEDEHVGKCNFPIFSAYSITFITPTYLSTNFRDLATFQIKSDVSLLPLHSLCFNRFRFPFDLCKKRRRKKKKGKKYSFEQNVHIEFTYVN